MREFVMEFLFILNTVIVSKGNTICHDIDGKIIN